MHRKTHNLGWIVGAVVLTCGISALRGPQGLTGPFDLFRQIREMQKQNSALEIEIAEKQERLRRLEGSQSDSELEVKKRLKYLKPGERLMVLPNNSQQQQQPQQAPPDAGQPTPAANPQPATAR